MRTRPVVVTGLGVICAAGADVTRFWDRLMSGTTAITPILRDEYSFFPNAYAGQVPDEWLDDPETTGLDRAAALTMIAARQALAQAGLDPSTVDPTRLGIVLGRCQATAPPDGGPGYAPMHAVADVLAGRIGATGPRIILSTACAAGGNAVGLARDKILTGEADVVLAGGVDPLLRGTFAGFAGLQALKDGPCAPYSRSDGLNLGEGAAFLLVEPLDLALARGAVPLAEVAGYGLSADAYHATAPDPTGRGGTSAVRRAFADAGIGPQDVSYVNGHGTGTTANDRMERKVMRNVFAERAGSVPTSSIKSFTGHTLGAAGAVEAVASVLALQHHTAPPTTNFDTDALSGEELDFVPNTPRAMPMDVVVSNNYAFGGNNVSLVLRTPSGPREYEPLPEADVVITGIGPVSALGVGVANFAAALRAGGTGIGPITAFDSTGFGLREAAQAPSLDFRTFAPRTLWRHMNSLSRLSIAASRLAWEDAGLVLDRAGTDNVGLMFATAAGSIESSSGFDESVLADPNKPAVLSFSNVVLNATGGAVCQTLGLRGPTTTICHGGASASIALDCAVETIRTGKADVVILLATDEFGPLTITAGERAGRISPSSTARPYDRGRDGSVPGTAAIALVLESAAHATGRGARAYAKVLATSHTGAVPGADALEHATRAVAGIAASTQHSIGLVVGTGTGEPGDAAEAIAVADVLPKALLTATAGQTGDCAAASGAINIAVAALAIHDATVPPTVGLTDPESGSLDRYSTVDNRPDRVGTVLALTLAPGSVRGCVLLGEAS